LRKNGIGSLLLLRVGVSRGRSRGRGRGESGEGAAKGADEALVERVKPRVQVVAVEGHQLARRRDDPVSGVGLRRSGGSEGADRAGGPALVRERGPVHGLLRDPRRRLDAVSEAITLRRGEGRALRDAVLSGVE
jgi:hypothetical protein